MKNSDHDKLSPKYPNVQILIAHDWWVYALLKNMFNNKLEYPLACSKGRSH
jgi:hypothetical protein